MVQYRLWNSGPTTLFNSYPVPTHPSPVLFEYALITSLTWLYRSAVPTFKAMHLQSPPSFPLFVFFVSTFVRICPMHCEACGKSFKKSRRPGCLKCEEQEEVGRHKFASLEAKPAAWDAIDYRGLSVIRVADLLHYLFNKTNRRRASAAVAARHSNIWMPLIAIRVFSRIS
jgi:hypothetical protein